MEHTLQWTHGCFDEMELVLEKADANETTAKLFRELESGALAEARANCHLLRSGTPEDFDAQPISIKEELIAALSTVGLAAFSAPLTEPKLTVRFSPNIQQVRCCTALSLLNRLEKLDGAYNMLHPQATLELQVPLGGKKGLVPIEMLICMLYPWLKVKEVASNEVASELPAPAAAAPHQPEPPKTAAQTVPAQPEILRESKKPTLWQKLFGKK